VLGLLRFSHRLAGAGAGGSVVDMAQVECVAREQRVLCGALEQDIAGEFADQLLRQSVRD